MADMNAAAVVKPATRAYVTLLANDDDDGAHDNSFKGVVRLAKGLRDAGSAYPLVVAVQPDVPESRRRVLIDELGCVVREVQPVYPHAYNKLRIWEFVEYDQMMYLDARFHGPLEKIHEQFEPNHGPPPAPCVDADMFVFKPSMATARLLLHGLAFMMSTTISDHHAARMAFAHGVVVGMRSRRTSTTIADRQQPAASSSSSQPQINNVLTIARLVMAFFIAAVAALNIIVAVMDSWRLTRRT